MSDVVQALKDQVVARVEEGRKRWIEIADAIHANPEIGFKEFQAVALLIEPLREHGFAVEEGVAGLETAFVAEYRGRKAGPVVGLMAEYDALLDQGHACGHNLMGTASVAAAIAVAPLLDQLPGTVQVIGTPAEEGGGGKIIMVEAGAFDHLDAALIFHPSNVNMSRRTALACFDLTMEFYGQAAHAAGSPDKGINALDACVLTYNNISALRQQLTDDVRIHGVITNGGGAVNVIPDYTAATFLVRAEEKKHALEVLEQVEACARAGALAAGARVELTRGDQYYANMIPNTVLADLFDANLEALGRPVEFPSPKERMGSTDMGNVSQVVPSLHPYVKIAPGTVSGHTLEFRAAAASPEGHAGMMDAAKALAMTAVDLIGRPELVEQAWAEHRARP